MTEKERFTVDGDGNYWDKINHRYVNLDYLFRLVGELDTKLDNKQHTINEMVKTIRIYDDGYIDLNKKYKKVVDENEQLKKELGSFEQVSFTDLCDGSRTVLYMKKENVGDSDD